MKFDAFFGGSNESQAVTGDVERCVNWYPAVIEQTGIKALLPTPGVTTLDTVALGSGRAHAVADGREFAVIGGALYEINAAGVATSRGSVALDSNPATISYNGQAGGQLFITSGGNGYSYALSTNTLTQVVALDGKATQGGHVDGYFLAIDAATSRLYVSALRDGTSWTTGSDFATRSLAPDPWEAMAVCGRLVYLPGAETTEIWHDTGDRFPFAPYPSNVLDYGIVAPFSLKPVGSDPIWLAQTRNGRVCVVRANPGGAQPISTPALECALSGYSNLAAASADVYAECGHVFYLLNFDRDKVTWAYDVTTGIWSERGTWQPDDNEYRAWRPRHYAYAFGEHRMLDAESGAIYRMGTDLSSDVGGLAIRRLRRAPYIGQENRRVFFNALELDLDAGLGNAVAPGDDPQVMLRMSNDGGRNWISEQWRSAGKTGEYSRRVRWNRLGMARKRVFEVSVTDPIPWRLTGCYLEFGE